MYWFKAWRDPDWVPVGDARTLLRMARHADTQHRQRRAIYALGYLPPSPEIFTALAQLADDVHVGDAAIYALGKSSDPQGKALALAVAKGGGPFADEAARAIGFDLRSPEQLLTVALTDKFYSSVKKAVVALRAWKTPEADAALQRFYDAPARSLNYERVDPLDSTGRNFEGEPWWTPRSSADLGQRPKK